MAPEYAKAATKLAESNSPVKLAKLDATEHKTAGGKFEIKGFPTLKFFRSGADSEYNGGRKADEIVSWLSKKSGPAATTVNSEEELTHIKEANDVFIIGAFADVNGAAAKAFLTAAGRSDTHTFAITSESSVKSALGVKGDAIVVIKTFDDLRNEMTASASTEEIEAFITANATPLVQVFSDASSAKIFKSTIQKHTLFFTTTSAAHHAATMAAFTEAAKDFKGETMVISVPETQNRVAEYFGFKESMYPAAVVADMSGGAIKKFPFTGIDLSDASAIKKFIRSALDGKVAATLKSEEPSAADTAGPVTVLTGKTFKDLVINNTKDVLVEFYAPWCGHCKSLAPVYEEVGKAFEHLENVVIAKMDATANEIDVPGVNVKGFPTLIFFKGNDKANPVKYEEGRSKNDFIAYLKKNAHNDVSSVAGDSAADDEDDEGSEGSADEEL